VENNRKERENTTMTAAPATKGKVVLHTTVGDLEIELWSKEAPKGIYQLVSLLSLNVCLYG